ncbi:hypothetical protein QR680_007457 [Steinernema hermaphroditum]|uniref:Zinc finger protein 830 n=1 Tax=Steinernema hermaphroditum TaxID=289476 RepID=A0AA39IDA3_9BILA|nr:hypothetical protein QR680_007457 [Steinernema hermaphroditum]
MTYINSAIARDLGNGNHFCLICQIEVKTKTWKAHNAGRQHRDSVQWLKAEVTTAPKRAVENGTTIPNEPAAKKPKDFDTPQSSAPWERERNSDKKEGKKSKKQSVSSVPDDFFEVQTIRSCRVSASEKRLDDELTLLEKEVAQIDLEQLRREDDAEAMEEEQRNVTEQDAEEVENRIEGWKRVNELEIKVEEMLRARAKRNIKKIEEESDSDDDVDILSDMNWRSRKF